MDPKTQAPLPSKKYYDFVSWLTTQIFFAFATAPFLVLSFSGSITAWSRVYFFAIIGTLASMGFFASPAKLHLRRMLEQRAAKASSTQQSAGAPVTPGATNGSDSSQLRRSVSTDSLRDEAVLGLGLSSDPQRDLDEALSEIRAEVDEARRRAELKMKSNPR